MIRIRTSKAKWLCSLLFITVALFGSAQTNVSMIFVGDVMQHDGQIEAAYNKTNESYEYEDGFKFVRPIIQEYDLRIANLEVTLAGKPYKGYPQFSAPDELAETLVSSGFNVILTSNNHSCDRGEKGVVRTLDKLDELGVKHTGTFRNKAERDANYPLMIQQNEMKIAMLNYTYGTNGLEVDAPLIINYIDSNVIRADVEKAKKLGADYIVCNLHWGAEYTFLPNSYQKTYEAFCYRVGVDMVIGGHPHTVQPVQVKKVKNEEKLTVWSLGNFVSNMQTRPTRGGLMVGATIKKEGGKVVLDEVEHILIYVMKKSEGAVTQYYILPDFDYNSIDPDFVDKTNLTHMENFLSDSRKLFDENNVGSKERKIDANSTIGKLYASYLTSYYSVEVATNKDALLRDKNLAPFVHEHVDSGGTAHILSGVCKTTEEAKSTLNFIRDCGFAEAKIVKVTQETVSAP